MSAELNVQLRLLLDQVQGDATKAAEIIKRTIGEAMGGGGGGGGGVPAGRKGPQETDAERAAKVLERAAKKDMRDKESFYKNMSMLAGPVFSPGSGLSTMFAARQVFTALRTDEGKQKVSQILTRLFSREKGRDAATPPKIIGAGIGASVAGTAILVGGATAVGLALKGLQSAVEGAADAVRRAGGIYAKAAMSGFGVRGTTSRGIYSSVIGVSENEIMRFGAAVNYLNPRLKTAIDTVSRTTQPLTQVNWEFEILKQNMMALFANIAAQAAPAIFQFANAINRLLDVINNNQGIIKLMTIAAAGTIGGPAGMWHAYQGMKGNYGQMGSGIPSPAPFMKQLPASAWEKMGLVIGGVGSTNYAQQTANNTSRSAKFLEYLAKGKFNTANPFAGDGFSAP